LTLFYVTFFEDKVLCTWFCYRIWYWNLDFWYLLWACLEKKKMLLYILRH